MKITKVCCQGCGADLDVDESVHYVTCNYCHARLEVLHDTSVTHTRLIEQIHESTQQMAGNLKVIELQNDLVLLDREWEVRKEGFMVKGRQGLRYVPTRASSRQGGITLIVLGLIWLGLAVNAPPPIMVLFPVMGLVAIGFGFHMLMNGNSKAAA